MYTFVSTAHNIHVLYNQIKKSSFCLKLKDKNKLRLAFSDALNLFYFTSKKKET